MICCLNPDCPNPLNPDGTNFCLSCGTGLKRNGTASLVKIEPGQISGTGYDFVLVR